MKQVAFALTVLLAAAGGMTGQMPYPLASTYVATAESGDGWSVTATAVGNTNGRYGHTISMEVQVYNPARTRGSYNSSYYYTYYSSTTANLPLCSGGVCEDGAFTAETDWSTEYCPIADEYMNADSATGQQVVSAYVYVSAVDWDPTCVEKQDDDSKFRVVGVKSPGCDATAISLGKAFVGIPSTVLFNSQPPQSAQGCSSPGEGCYREWTVTTLSSNQSTGKIHGSGVVAGVTGDCTIKMDAKSADLEVKDSCP